MNDDRQITKELNELFQIKCRACGHVGVEFTNGVRYYDFTGKVGSADLNCQKCGKGVTFDE